MTATMLMFPVTEIPALRIALCAEPPIWETWEGLPSRSGWRRAVLPPAGVSVSFRRRKSLPRVGGDPALSLIQAMRVVSPRRENALREDGRGIDLAKRGDEVRKLFYAAFARGLIKDGIDPEEALQEVYKGLLSRNRGTCPFDVTKSSFGHYVHIVTRCVLANFVRKEKTRTLYETPSETLRSGSSFDDGGSSTSGAWEGVSPANQEYTPRALVHLLEGVREHIPEGCDPSRLAVALDHMAQGYTKREAALQAGVDSKHLAVVLEHLRAGLPRRTAT